MAVLFSSSQCTNQLPEHKQTQPLPHWLCLPTTEIIFAQIKTALHDTRDAKTVYIATNKDYHELWLKLSREFPDVQFVTPSSTLEGRKVTQATSKPTLIIDTYLLSHSDYFIGNCMSSFTAFSGRLRVHGLNLSNSTTFFGLQELLNKGEKPTPRTEL